MKQMHAGSTITVVLIFMALLAIIGLSAYKSSIFLHHFGIQRERAIANHVLVQSLLNYGIAMAVKDFDEIWTNKRSREITLNIDNGIAHVSICLATYSIDLIAQLEKQGVIVQAAHCRLTKNSDQKLSIEGFQRDGFAL